MLSTGVGGVAVVSSFRGTSRQWWGPRASLAAWRRGSRLPPPDPGPGASICGPWRCPGALSARSKGVSVYGARSDWWCDPVFRALARVELHQQKLKAFAEWRASPLDADELAEQLGGLDFSQQEPQESQEPQAADTKSLEAYF
eukprot:COSAG01_NODE_482_length_16412_cov_47.760130_3_plen_143_part_00